MKKGVVYCTTNLITHKKYIGIDSRNDSNYLGSGKILKQALKKYGKQNFKKEILAFSSNKDLLKELEIYFIDYFNAQKSDLFYNISKGGIGGDLFTDHKDKELINRKKSISMKRFNKINGNHNIGKKYKRKVKNNQRGLCIYCKKEFALNILSQFHSNHCFQNPNINVEEEKLRRFQFNHREIKRSTCLICKEEHGNNVISRYHNEKCLKKSNLTEKEILIQKRKRKRKNISAFNKLLC